MSFLDRLMKSTSSDAMGDTLDEALGPDFDKPVVISVGDSTLVCENVGAWSMEDLCTLITIAQRRARNVRTSTPSKRRHVAKYPEHKAETASDWTPEVDECADVVRDLRERFGDRVRVSQSVSAVGETLRCALRGKWRGADRDEAVRILCRLLGRRTKLELFEEIGA